MFTSSAKLSLGLVSLLVASSGCSMPEEPPVDSGVVRDSGAVHDSGTPLPTHDSGTIVGDDAGSVDPTPDVMDPPIEDSGTPDPGTTGIRGIVTTRTISGTDAVPGARLDALASLHGASIANAMTDASGAYALSLPGTDPFDGVIHVTAAGYLDMYHFPTAPISGDYRGLDLDLVNQSSFGLLTNFAGAMQTPGSGFIGLVVQDASGNPMAGVTVFSTPAGTVRYMSGGLPSSSATSTGADGVAFIFSVPVGPVTVNATAPGMTLRPHAIGTVADAMSAVVLVP